MKTASQVLYPPKLLVLFLVLTTFSIGSLRFQYVVLGLALPLLLIPRLPLYRLGFSGFFAIRFSSALIFSAWCYGVFLGLATDVNPLLVFSNFAGMSLYLPFSFFITSYRPSFSKIEGIVGSSAIFYVFVSIFGIWQWGFTGFGDVTVFGLTAFRAYYSIGSLIFLPFLCVNLFGLFSAFTFYRVLKIAVSLFFLFLTGSKGVYLAVAVLAILFVVTFLQSCFQGTAKPKILVSTLIGILGFILLINTSSFYYAITESLMFELSSSHPRSVQRDALVAEFSMLGAGLGAPLDSGFARDALGYGFELTYHNILHKLGLVVGVLVVVVLAVPFIWSMFKTIRHPKSEAPLVLGLTSYLIVGYGNPIVFAPMLVSFSVLGLYLMDRSVRPFR